MSEEEKTERLQAALDELKSINNIIDRISRVRDTNHIMSIIIDELVKTTRADQGVINLLSEEKRARPVTVVRKEDTRPDQLPYTVDNLITGWVLNHKKVLKIDELDADDRFSTLSSEAGRFKSLLCCPMIVRGEIIGLISLTRSQDKGSFSEADGRLAGIVGSQSGQILSNALLLEELAHKNELLEISEQKLHHENVRLKVELQKTFTPENIVGQTAVMREVLALASKVSTNNSPVLITGPTGTGKELIARTIHYQSGRRDKPFIVKNCGVKTESLLEAELFGYVKGAFTGAERDKNGLFKEADGGTVFLDEIGEAPPSIQVAILRVLETGEIKPVGANRTEYVDVRIISATNRDLKKDIDGGSFRQDLFYRLNTFVIELPPLNRRREDIPLLVHYFIEKLKIKLNKPDLSVSPAALEIFSGYSWPGNIRQLENELERAAVVSDDEIIDIDDLSKDLLGYTPDPSTIPAGEGRMREVVEQVEKEMIVKTLHTTGGNILKTSRMLGLTRKGLKDKMTRYGIPADPDHQT